MESEPIAPPEMIRSCEVLGPLYECSQAFGDGLLAPAQRGRMTV